MASSQLSKDEVKARAKAAILGAIVADAASMPLHWIYDVQKIESLLKEAGRSTAAPEFYPTPSCPYYNQEGAKNHVFGGSSPYGEEIVPLAAHLAVRGDLDSEAFAEAFVSFFLTSPSYRNVSVRGTIAAWEEGKRGAAIGHESDFQANCFAKVPLLVARFAGKPELLPKVEAAVRVQQNNDAAVAYGTAAALVLEKIVLGSTIEEALQWAAAGGLAADQAALAKRGLEARDKPLTEICFEPASYMKEMMDRAMALKGQVPALTTSMWCNGPACGNPSAFANVCLVSAVHKDSYVEGVRANLVAGGDNCSRSLLIGAILAAQGGIAAIPEEWRKQTSRYAQFEVLADKLVAHL